VRVRSFSKNDDICRKCAEKIIRNIATEMDAAQKKRGAMNMARIYTCDICGFQSLHEDDFNASFPLGDEFLLEAHIRPWRKDKDVCCRCLEKAIRNFAAEICTCATREELIEAQAWEIECYKAWEAVSHKQLANGSFYAKSSRAAMSELIESCDVATRAVEQLRNEIYGTAE
jgi:hypothetical protein